MQELINRLIEKTGISPDQAHKSIETIKDFVKEKFPMLGGAVDNMFASAPADTVTATTPNAGGSILDKISDVIPGQAGEKAEEFIKDKFGGMFGDDKK
jgi:hypothetical protein